MTDTLVADLAQTELSPLGSQPRAFVSNGVFAYFTASGELGRELWTTDGTQAGTFLVDDGNPGIVNTFSSAFARPSIAFLPGGGEAALLLGRSDAHGEELWFTPGRNGPVTQLADIAPGIDDSVPEDLTAFQGALWFLADDGIHGRELWMSDGTAAGTTLAVDLIPGAASPWSAPSSTLDGRLASTGARLLIAAPFGGGVGLFSSDGSAAGTFQLVLLPGATDLEPFDVDRHGTVNGRVLFGARSTDPAARGLWSSDGTFGGTERLTTDGEVQWVVVDGNRAFVSIREGSDGRLYVTDGTPAGTTQLMGVGFPYLQPTSTRGALFQGELYLGAWAQGAPGGNAGSELVRTDGTVAGTTLAVDVWPGPSASGPQYLQVHAGRLFFEAKPSVDSPRRPFVTDGTPGGTEQLVNLEPTEQVGLADTFTLDPPASPLVTVANGVVGPYAATTFPSELGRLGIDGFEIVAEIGPIANGSAEPRRLTRSGDRLFFFARTGAAPLDELWVVDANLDLPPERVELPEDLLLERLVAWRGGVAFTGRSQALPPLNFIDRLYWTDGDQVDLLIPVEWESVGNQLTVVGDRLYFRATNRVPGTAFGRELCWTDGTPGAPVVLDLTPGPGDTAFGDQAAFGERLLLAADLPGGDIGLEVVLTDGTLAGTEELDLDDGAVAAEPEQFAVAGDHFFFGARTASTGLELWISDGTLSGTQLVADLTPGPNPSELVELTPFGAGVLFGVENFIAGYAPYVSDGTGPGTFPLLPPDPLIDPFGVSPKFIDAGSSGFFFWGANQARVLYSTDGTVAGTLAVAGEGIAGAELGLPNQIGLIGEGAVAFLADGKLLGGELWVSDGTVAGTDVVTDTFPGATGSQPREITRVGAMVYMAAFAPLIGRELHAVPVGVSGAWLVESLADGCGASGAGLSSNDAPLVGAPFAVDLSSGIPATVAALYTDFDVNLLGTPGPCDIYLPWPRFLLTGATDGVGETSFPLFFGANPALVGRVIYLQAFTLEAGGPLLGLGSLSNVLEVIVGG